MKNLNYRKDVRSVSEFKEDIKVHTIKEKTLMDLWSKLIKENSIPIEVIDNGIDNTGELITGKVNRNADYRIKIDNIERKLEIKTSPVKYKATFKKDDLESYLKQEDTGILLFIGTGRPMDGNFPLPESKWAILNSFCMEKITKVGLFSERDFRFGYKATFMVTTKQMEEVLGINFRPLFAKIEQ